MLVLNIRIVIMYRQDSNKTSYYYNLLSKLLKFKLKPHQDHSIFVCLFVFALLCLLVFKKLYPYFCLARIVAGNETESELNKLK